MNAVDKHGRIWFTAFKGATAREAQLLGLSLRVSWTEFSIQWHSDWLSQQDKLKKCRKCARFVKSPCNDAEGFHTEGPWDYSCEGIFYPERYQ
jgi:hypothetical protein